MGWKHNKPGHTYCLRLKDGLYLAAWLLTSCVGLHQHYCWATTIMSLVDVQKKVTLVIVLNVLNQQVCNSVIPLLIWGLAMGNSEWLNWSRTLNVKPLLRANPTNLPHYIDCQLQYAIKVVWLLQPLLGKYTDQPYRRAYLNTHLSVHLHLLHTTYTSVSSMLMLARHDNIFVTVSEIGVYKRPSIRPTPNPQPTVRVHVGE